VIFGTFFTKLVALILSLSMRVASIVFGTRMFSMAFNRAHRGFAIALVLGISMARYGTCGSRGTTVAASSERVDNAMLDSAEVVI